MSRGHKGSIYFTTVKDMGKSFCLHLLYRSLVVFLIFFCTKRTGSKLHLDLRANL